MNNAELIKAIRENEECNNCSMNGDCNERKMSLAAAAALEAVEKRIAELERILKAVQENSGINFRLWQEAEARMQTVTDCHALESER